MKRNTNVIILLVVIIIALAVFIVIKSKKTDTTSVVSEAVSTPITGEVATTPPTTTPNSPTKSVATKTTTSTKPAVAVKDKTLLENNPYIQYGFYVDTPANYRVAPQGTKDTVAMVLNYPGGNISYIKDAAKYEQSTINKYKYKGIEKIGINSYKVYVLNDFTHYWVTKGNIGYDIITNKKDTLESFEILD